MIINNGGNRTLLITDKTVGLSDRQRTFIAAYLKTGNASEAARQAGFNWPGQKGAKLLKTAKIRAAIDAELKPYLFSRSQVLAILSELTVVNLGDFIDEHGQPVVEKIRTNGRFVKKYKARVIRSLSTDQVTVTDVRIELDDRLKALRTLGKMLGLFSDNSRMTSFVNQFFHSLNEALLRFVPAENRASMVAFLRERLD
ncbi:MAG TPA: terminase small subunit [Verrucomicrobiae bacterium]|nr:terminase small subunit [Verrucomicrobiae bacterium]